MGNNSGGTKFRLRVNWSVPRGLDIICHGVLYCLVGRCISHGGDSKSQDATHLILIILVSRSTVISSGTNIGIIVDFPRPTSPGICSGLGENQKLWVTIPNRTDIDLSYW